MAGLRPEIIAKWQSAIQSFDAGKLSEARQVFSEIQDFSAKILFNMSTVDFLLADYTLAHKRLTECLTRDSYLAVASFQQGVLACLLGRLNEGKESFSRVLQNIRGRDFIDYRQLGMEVRLTKEQVQHNLNVVQQKLRKPSNASVRMSNKELMTLPVQQCIFRPAKSLVDNLEKRQFLKEAKIVSAVPDVKPLVKSNSTPTSPVVGRKQYLTVTQSSHPGAHTPPPSRPPPRLPQGSSGAALGHSFHGNVNKSDSELDRTSQVKLPGEEKQNGQPWFKGSKHGMTSSTGVVSPGMVSGVATRTQTYDNQGSKGTQVVGQRVPPPTRQPPRLPVASGDDKKLKPMRPPPPKKP